jgi:hypothetical protein
LGYGVLAQIPNPQSPIPNPQVITNLINKILIKFLS